MIENMDLSRFKMKLSILLLSECGNISSFQAPMELNYTRT